MESANPDSHQSTKDSTQPQSLRHWISTNNSMIRAALLPLALTSMQWRGTSREENLSELVAETTTRLLAHEERFDPQKPPIGWTLGFAQKVALGWMRDALRDQERRADLPEGFEPSDQGKAAKQIDDKILTHQVLETLPDQDRQLVRLFVLEDRNANEVGTELGITPVAVRVRWHRLQKQLQGRFVSEDRA